MKYLSIDIETLGLCPTNCDIIEFGAVVDDLRNPRPFADLPKYHCYFKPSFKAFRGEPYAMSMHPKMLKRIAIQEGGYNYHDMWSFVPDFKLFLNQQFAPTEKIVLAGKNVATFDLRFLRKLPGWETLPIHHRVLDPAMLYLDISTDDVPPSSEECCKRAGMSHVVTHTAIEDAIRVCELLRWKLK
jgi:hypothetical protein